MTTPERTLEETRELILACLSEGLQHYILAVRAEDSAQHMGSLTDDEIGQIELQAAELLESYLEKLKPQRQENDHG